MGGGCGTTLNTKWQDLVTAGNVVNGLMMLWQLIVSLNTMLQDLVTAGAMDRDVAFGPDSADDEVLRGLQASQAQMQQVELLSPSRLVGEGDLNFKLGKKS